MWVAAGVIPVVIIAALLIMPGSPVAEIFAQATATPTHTLTLTDTPQPTSTATLAPSATAVTATDEPTVVVIPSDTPSPTDTPTGTPSPSATNTQTPTSTPDPGVVGGADMLAFLNNDNNIYTYTFRDQALEMLTKDFTPGKSDLQWSPDGDRVLYRQGLCLKSVSLEGEMEQITCFDGVSNFDAFAISEAGDQLALSVDRLLYVIPYDLETLKTASGHAQLSAFSPIKSHCLSVRESVRGIRWSAREDALAVRVYMPGTSGELGENIGLIDIDHCDDENAGYIDIFPGYPFTRFTTEYYQANPQIPSYDWGAEDQIIFTDAFRNKLGNIYVYDNELQKLINFGEDTALKLIDDACCYGDVHWSPDDQYLLFVFQDSEAILTQLYYIPVESLGTGAAYEPLPLEEGMLGSLKIAPIPVLRPAR